MEKLSTAQQIWSQIEKRQKNKMSPKRSTSSTCRRNGVAEACVLLSVVACNFSTASAFTFTPSTVQTNTLPKHSLHVLFAKAPPTSNFDLDAIEALEAELDYQEKLKNQNNEEEKIDEDDWEALQSTADLGGLKEHEVTSELNNKRIDAILTAMEPELSRSQCGSLISDGMVAVLTPEDKENGQKPTVSTRKSLKLPQGTIIHVKLATDETPTEIVAQNLPLNILYEDEHMIVLNKAAGMVVHPAVGNWDGTVVNALAYYLANDSPCGAGEFFDGEVQADKGKGVKVDGTDGETISFRPGIVHRLDKGTTGILVVAKTRESLTALSKSFANREVRKTYVAITVGNPGKRVVIDKPIGRHPIHRQKMRVVPDPSKMNSSGMSPKQRRAAGMGGKSAAQIGRNALSFVDTLAFDGKLSVAQVRIETGRTHQIRVHLQDRTTPVYGDDVYGLTDWNKRLAKSQQIQRPLLHAFRLEINHPVTGKKMIFRAPMADDMMKVATGTWPDGNIDRPDLFEPMDVEIEE